MAEKKKLYILNLLQESSVELLNFFVQEGHTIVKREEYSDNSTIDVVLLESEDDVDSVREEFSIDSTKTQFFINHKVKHLKKFLVNGGRFTSNYTTFPKAIQNLAISPRSQNNTSLHMSDFVDGEIFRFSIVNHLMVGMAIDELSVRAFQAGFSLVSIRSLVDSLMYYLVYLKQAGFAGIPFECEYSISEGQFVFRISAMVNNFSMENIVDSFEDNNTQGQVRYLLSAAVNSCNFFDMTLFENPNKLMLTAFFDENSKSKNWGLLINNIPYASLIGESEHDQLYRDAKKRAYDLEGLQGELEGKNLSGGFDYFNFALDDDSIFNNSETSAQTVIDFMMDLFRESYPNLSPIEFNKEYFDEFKLKYEDQELMLNLSENDEHYIVEQVQKSHISKAYERARKEIKDDQSIILDLQKTMSEEVANRVSDYVDDEVINNVLSLEEKNVKSGATDTIFGAFEPSVSSFKKESAFESLSFSFAAPVIGIGLTVDDLEAEMNQDFLDPFENIPNDVQFEEEDFSVFHSSVLPPHLSMGTDDVIKLDSSFIDDFDSEIEKVKGDDGHFVDTFSSNFDENLDDDVFKVNGWTEDDDNFKTIVRSAMEDLGQSFSLHQSVQSFIKKEAPSRIKEELKKFANENDEDLSMLAHEKIKNFAKENIPRIMNDLLADNKKLDVFKDQLTHLIENKDDDLGLSPFQKKFKDRLERNVQKKVDLEQVDGHFQLPENKLSNDERKEIVAATMKEVFDEEFAFENASPAEIEKKENLLVEELSKTLNMPKEEVRVIVKGAIEKTKQEELQIVSQFFEQEEHWQNHEGRDQKLKSLEEENKELKTHISALQLQLHTNDSMKSAFDDLMSGKEISQEEINRLAEEDFMRLDRSLEKESELRDALKDKVTELKKLELELGKRELVFNKELDKLKKALHGKNMVLDKAKEGIKVSMQKKESQIINLKHQVASLTHKLKELEDETDKPKMLRRDDKEVLLGEEVKNLRKRIEMEMDAHEETQEKYQELREEIVSERSKAATLEKRLKTLENELNLLEDQNENLLNTADPSSTIKAEQMAKENEQLKQQLETMQEKMNSGSSESMTIVTEEDLERLMEKNTQLNNKVKELMAKLKKAENANVANSMGDGSVKEKHLKKNIEKMGVEITKLRSDYAEKKKEAVKYKTEVTGLKNKMATMKKDLDRLNKQLSKARTGKKAA